MKINPTPTPANKEELDKLLDQEVKSFEHFYSKVQQEKGFDGSPLMSVERAAVKAYLVFAATERDAHG